MNVLWTFLQRLGPRPWRKASTADRHLHCLQAGLRSGHFGPAVALPRL